MHIHNIPLRFPVGPRNSGRVAVGRVVGFKSCGWIIIAFIEIHLVLETALRLRPGDTPTLQPGRGAAP